jgi:ParB-like chromosome segregation protein Spo0J
MAPGDTTVGSRPIPNERNARIHTRESVDALARQIGEVGWTNPILVAGRKNNILAGHRRRLAAIQRKMEFVPVIDLGHLSAQQRRAYIIWDNKSTIEGDWDEELLTIELGELRDSGFDLSLTGFDAGELSALFDDPPPPEPEPVRRTIKSVECPKCHHAFAP